MRPPALCYRAATLRSSAFWKRPGIAEISSTLLGRPMRDDDVASQVAVKRGAAETAFMSCRSALRRALGHRSRAAFLLATLAGLNAFLCVANGMAR